MKSGIVLLACASVVGCGHVPRGSRTVEAEAQARSEPERSYPVAPASPPGAVPMASAPMAPEPAEPAPESASHAEDRGGAAVDRTEILAPARQPAKPVAQAETLPPRAARKVHYDGYLRVVATKPDELLGRAVELAKSTGGYVESLRGAQLIVRVPIAGFRTLFERLLGLGEVLQQQISARDITDAYQAIELRLRVLKASRSRLMQILGQVRSEQDKLGLLDQIKRLTEQIDQLELQLHALAQLAAYSRITLDAVPRPQPAAGLAQRELGAFRWIERLSPFRREVSEAGDRFEIPVPQGLVELDHDDSFWGGDPWIARSPDGVALWTCTRKNNPRGSATFWREALTTRLAPAYSQHELYQLGGFLALELREQDNQRREYRYVIAVRVDGDELQLVEAYYPSAKQQKHYGPAIRAVIEQLPR